MIDQVQSVTCNAGYIKHSIPMLSICVPTVETYCPQQKTQYPGNFISRLAGPGNEAKVREEFCKSPNHSELKSCIGRSSHLMNTSF